MAPNNALAARQQNKQQQPPPNTVVIVETATPNNNSNNNNNHTTASSRTTILNEGIVQSRGHGSKSSINVIHQEIQDFLQHNRTKHHWVYIESRSFFTVWTFLTRLPGPTYVDHHPGYLMLGMIYFPLVGSMIGIWITQFYNIAHITMGLPSIIAAAISIASSLWLTGCFHEDGVRMYVCLFVCFVWCMCVVFMCLLSFFIYILNHFF
jgi:hypothetical protein